MHTGGDTGANFSEPRRWYAFWRQGGALLELPHQACVAPRAGEGIMFLFTDSQIIDEKMLVYVNDLLASGMRGALVHAPPYTLQSWAGGMPTSVGGGATAAAWRGMAWWGNKVAPLAP